MLLISSISKSILDKSIFSKSFSNFIPIFPILGFFISLCLNVSVANTSNLCIYSPISSDKKLYIFSSSAKINLPFSLSSIKPVFTNISRYSFSFETSLATDMFVSFNGLNSTSPYTNFISAVM